MLVKTLRFTKVRIANLCWLTLMIMLVVTAIGPVPARADAAVILRADGQFSLAERLFTQQKYTLARLEYERFIHFFPDDERISQAYYRIGLAYYFQRQYEAAIQTFRSLVGVGKLSSEFHARAFFMAAESQLRLGRPSAALTTLRNLEIQVDNQVERDEAFYRMGWIYLDLGDWERAHQVFKKISANSQERLRIPELIRQLETSDQIDRLSPGLAGTLAIIPGGGYLYCRRYQDALISFLVNGALIYAAYESFDNDLNALGGLIAFVEVGFYSGNIYGSISSAHKYNRNRQRAFIDHLKQNLRIDLSARPQNKGLELALSYRF